MSALSQQNNKRIAKNTLLLYFRMLFMMAVNLYTSRVILVTLGVEDYGIYNVVAGIVALSCFIGLVKNRIYEKIKKVKDIIERKEFKTNSC